MKKIIYLSIIAVFAFLFIFPLPVLASNKNREKKIISVAQDQVIDQDFFAAGDVIEIYGIINGDAYLAAGEIRIKGVVNGDLLAIGGQVDISGTISQNARLLAGQVDINGNIGKTLNLAVGNLSLAETANVGKAVVGLGGNLDIQSPVADYIMAAAGNVTLGNQVGDVDLAVGNLRLTPTALVNGHLNYISDSQASFSSQDQVLGEIKYQPRADLQMPKVDKQNLLKVLAGIYAFIRISSYIAILVVGVLAVSLFPRFSLQVTQTLEEKPWLSLLWGVLFAIIVPLVSIILLITIVGLPLGLTVFLLYSLIMFFCQIFIMLWLGKAIAGFLGTKEVGIWAFILGSLVYMLVSLFLPLVGGLLTGIGSLIGLGAALQTKRKIYCQLRQKMLI